MANDKISNYTLTAVTMKSTDLMDVSIDDGVGGWDTKKITWTSILGALPAASTIYTTSAALAAPRTVTLSASNTLTFTGGLTTLVGEDNSSGFYALKVQDSTNADILAVRNDGFVGIGYTSPTVGSVERFGVLGIARISGRLDIGTPSAPFVAYSLYATKGGAFLDGKVIINDVSAGVVTCKAFGGTNSMHYGSGGTTTYTKIGNSGSSVSSILINGTTNSNRIGFGMTDLTTGATLFAAEHDFDFFGRTDLTTIRLRGAESDVVNDLRNSQFRLTSNHWNVSNQENHIDILNTVINTSGDYKLGFEFGGTETFKMNSDLSVTFISMTATVASALTVEEGKTVMVNNTNGTFTSIGLWCYQNGAWAAL